MAIMVYCASGAGVEEDDIGKWNSWERLGVMSEPKFSTRVQTAVRNPPTQPFCPPTPPPSLLALKKTRPCFFANVG